MEFEAIAEAAVRDNRAAGLAISIVTGGAVRYARGFGVRSVASGAPVDAHTQFHSASVSKTVVAAALLRLECVGALRLTDKLLDHLPYVAFEDPRIAQVSLRQMLSHSAGWPDFGPGDWQYNGFDEPPDALEALAHRSRKSLTYDPGAGYAYSNDAYCVLGQVIAQASGLSFEAYVRERILRPVGMPNSTFLPSEVAPDRKTVGHRRVDGKLEVHPQYPYYRALAPCQALHVSAVELAQWAIFHLSRGHSASQTVLPDSAFYRLWHAYALVEPNCFRGLSWALVEREGQPQIFHYGGDEGFASGLFLFPARNAAVAVLSNNDWDTYDIDTTLIDSAVRFALSA